MPPASRAACTSPASFRSCSKCRICSGVFIVNPWCAAISLPSYQVSFSTLFGGGDNVITGRISTLACAAAGRKCLHQPRKCGGADSVGIEEVCSLALQFVRFDYLS
jgi:predicted transcriptional regulator of viral defense system